VDGKVFVVLEAVTIAGFVEKTQLVPKTQLILTNSSFSESPPRLP